MTIGELVAHLVEPCECAEIQAAADVMVGLMENKHNRYRIAGDAPDWPLKIECRLCNGRRQRLTEIGREIGQLVLAELAEEKARKGAKS